MRWNKNKAFPMFIKVMTGVATLLRVPMLNEEELEVYFKYLSKKFETVEDFIEASDKLVENADKVFDNRKEFPRVSSFLQFKSLANDQEIDLMARDAWNIVLDTAIIQGEKINPDFGDQVIVETINKLGGWANLCRNISYSTTNEDLRRREKNEDKFIKTYFNIASTCSVRNDSLSGVGKKKIEIKLSYKPLIEPKKEVELIESNKTKEVINGIIKKVKINK